jgi:hypothetical protein
MSQKLKSIRNKLIENRRRFNETMQEIKANARNYTPEGQKAAVADAYARANRTYNELKRQLEQETEAQRAALVERLRQPAQLTNEGKRAFREAVDKVEAANEVQRRELIRRAIRWNDRELARVLTVAVCGDRGNSVFHEQLKELDPDVNKLYEFESEFGTYSPRVFGPPITIRQPSDITHVDISAAESRLDAAARAEAG